MTHSCRINYLEISEDGEGFLYFEWKKVFGTITNKFKIEYCPVCGQKAKKSSIEYLAIFPRDDIAETQFEQMHKIIIENFIISCEILVKEELDDCGFQFCLETIRNTLRYIEAKRKG